MKTLYQTRVHALAKEQIKAAITKKFVPAIDCKEPYPLIAAVFRSFRTIEEVKVMLDMAADAALAAIEASGTHVLMPSDLVNQNALRKEIETLRGLLAAQRTELTESQAEVARLLEENANLLARCGGQ